MLKKTIVMGFVACSFVFLATSAQAALMYADQVTRLLRGDTSVGNYTSFYGGAFPGDFPVPLTVNEAEYAVLGAPDSQFLSLPGRDDTPTGSGFAYTYVEVAFPSVFNADSDLYITELGQNLESAQLWIWTTNGSNVQTDITRNGLDTLMLDLTPYEYILAGTESFTRVGIGGLDIFGASQGFDLDAIGVTAPVAEPATIFLLGAGLLGIAGSRKKLKKSA